MGLLKHIELDNGVIANYHRVTSVNVVTNIQNVIEVTSYTSKEKRDEEIDAIANKTPMNVYINTRFLVVDYDQNMTVETAYEYLKTLPEFKGAEDV